MLAITESLIKQQDLDWAFCDTDSMAIAKPAEINQANFFERAQKICSWFEPLNPYEQKGSLLKIEDANFKIDGNENELESLYCFCISAKRYVLFNLKDGKPIIRKASAHGLGHLIEPHPEADAPTSILMPSVDLDEIGVRRWQYDLWIKSY